MYEKKRPLIVSCGRFPKGGYVALKTKASTISELKQDIMSKTNLTISDMNRYQFTVCNQVMTEGTIPLFEPGCGIVSTNQPEFDEAVANFATDLKDKVKGAKYIYVTMSENAKYVDSGMETISSCCEQIERLGLVDRFIECNGYPPEAANIRTLTSFLTSCKADKEATATRLEAGADPFSVVNNLVESVMKFCKNQNDSLLAEIRKLSKTVEDIKPKSNNADDDYDEDDDYDDDEDEDEDDEDEDGYDNDSEEIDIDIPSC